MNLSSSDQDSITRTVLAEAGPDASPVEQAAVAHVILNRLGRDDYPKTVPGVLFQRNAFEGWKSRTNANNSRPLALRYSSDDPAYARAFQTVNSVLTGSFPDPTGGADRFQNDSVVADRMKRRQVSKNVGLAPENALHIGPQSYWTTPQKTAAADISPDEEAAKFLAERRGKAQTSEGGAVTDDAAAAEYLKQRRGIVPSGKTVGPSADLSVPQRIAGGFNNLGPRQGGNEIPLSSLSPTQGEEAFAEAHPEATLAVAGPIGLGLPLAAAFPGAIPATAMGALGLGWGGLKAIGHGAGLGAGMEGVEALYKFLRPTSP